MKRRDFLGRVLGTIAATGLPWKATEVHPLYDGVLDTPVITEKVAPCFLSRLRSAIRLSDGTLLEGPGMVADYCILATRQLVFRFHDVHCIEQMHAVAAVILTERGTVFKESKFSGGGQWLMNGDTLKVTYTTDIVA
jgi:hypothetical protein